MKPKIYALGIGRFSPVCLELAEACGYEIAGLYHYDETRTGEMSSGFPILGSFEDLWAMPDLEGMDFVLTMGDVTVREETYRHILEKNGRCPMLVHPKAVVSRFADIAPSGVQIGPFTYVQANAHIGEDSIIMSHVNISHDATIGRHCNISGQSCVSADTVIDDFVAMGIQARTIPGRECIIGKHSVIGAGSLVTGIIRPSSVVKGALADVCFPKPLVSVIVTTFNHEKFIRDCLDSILNQKCNFNYEILVHDDASSDRTPEILKEYESAHPDIIRAFCAESNQSALGRDPWMDILFPKAKGKYLAICDGDDFWTDDHKLQQQVDLLSSDSSLVGCASSVVKVDEAGHLADDTRLYEDGRCTIRDYFYRNICYPTSSVMLRNTDMADITRLTHIMKNRFLTDWTMWVAAHIYGDFYTFGKPMAAYRINPASMTHTDVANRKLGHARDDFRIMRQVRGILPDEYADIRAYLGNETRLWMNLAKAYKGCGKYFQMLRCLGVYSVRRILVGKPKPPQSW